MNPIDANLHALNLLLQDAAKRSAEALDCALKGDRFEAIGTILGIDHELGDALALYQAAIVLHKHELRAP